MTRKIAASSALIVFAVSLLLGMRAQNTFATTVGRALIAMAATFVIGLVIGAMAEKMIQENVTNQKNMGNIKGKPGAEDR